MGTGKLYDITFLSDGEKHIRVAAKSEFYARKKAVRHLVGSGKYLNIDIVGVDMIEKEILL